MANPITVAAAQFGSPDQFVQLAGQLLTQGGPQALAGAEAQMVADGRPDLANNLTVAADFAATVNGRGDIKAWIEVGGLQAAVGWILG